MRYGTMIGLVWLLVIPHVAAEGPTMTLEQGVRWSPPSAMADGSPVVGLRGYHVYLTQTPGQYGAPARRVTHPIHTWQDTPGGMAPGQWYVRLTVLSEGTDAQGAVQLHESEPSEEFAFVLLGEPSGGTTRPPRP